MGGPEVKDDDDEGGAGRLGTRVVEDKDRCGLKEDEVVPVVRSAVMAAVTESEVALSEASD